MNDITTQTKEKEKQGNAKLSNGNTREDLINRLPIPGPGRPKDTQEQKIIKKAVKEFLKEYEMSFAEALPEISPVVIERAKQGNMQAIQEVHKVLGAYKKEGNVIVPIQINFNDDKEEFK